MDSNLNSIHFLLPGFNTACVVYDDLPKDKLLKKFKELYPGLNIIGVGNLKML